MLRRLKVRLAGLWAGVGEGLRRGEWCVVYEDEYEEENGRREEVIEESRVR